MKTLTLNKITGFESNACEIEILDFTGERFYFITNDEEKRITFNLPVGVYFTFVEVRELKRPLTYVTPRLPFPEKRISIPPVVDIYEEENPNKASVSTSKHYIVIDPEFVGSGVPREVFIKFHELGHYKYKTEWKCDVFSASEMLKRGFNPTQCYYSSAFCLSEKQDERKEILFRFLEKTKCNE